MVTASSALPREPVFWRVEGSLLNLTAVRPVGFFTWNAQSFLERWSRRGAMGVLAVARPVLYATNRVVATRLLHSVLRGVSRDRLDLLGEEYFEYVLKPRLKQQGVENLKKLLADRQQSSPRQPGARPHHAPPCGSSRRGSHPVQSPRLPQRHRHRPLGRARDSSSRTICAAHRRRPGWQTPRSQLVRDLGFEKNPQELYSAIQPALRVVPTHPRPVVISNSHRSLAPLSVRESLRGKRNSSHRRHGFHRKSVARESAH